MIQQSLGLRQFYQQKQGLKPSMEKKSRKVNMMKRRIIMRKKIRKVRSQRTKKKRKLTKRSLRHKRKRD